MRVTIYYFLHWLLKVFKKFYSKLLVVILCLNPVFEWYKDKAGKYRFRLKAANGEIITVSEGYNAKDDCEDGIESVKKNAPIAKIVEAKPQ